MLRRPGEADGLIPWIMSSALPLASPEHPARALRDPRLWIWSFVGWTAAGVFVVAQRALFRHSMHQPPPGVVDLGPRWRACGSGPRAGASRSPRWTPSTGSTQGYYLQIHADGKEHLLRE